MVPSARTRRRQLLFYDATCSMQQTQCCLILSGAGSTAACLGRKDFRQAVWCLEVCSSSAGGWEPLEAAYVRRAF